MNEWMNSVRWLWDYNGDDSDYDDADDSDMVSQNACRRLCYAQYLKMILSAETFEIFS